MKISREFAKIVVDLLEGKGQYDKQIAIEQLKSAIQDDIIYTKMKSENSSISPFLNSGVSIQTVTHKIKIATKNALNENY